MRTGVTVSASAHVVVLLVAIIGLSFPQQLTPDAEQSIAVDLVPLTDTASVRAGTEQSKVIDTKTPSTVESNKPVVPAQPAGNTEQVQPKPAKSDTPSPLPTTSTAPAPAPQPKPQPVVPAPKPQPQPALQPQPAPQPKPQPKDTSAPTPLSQLATDTSTSADSASDTPTPAAQAASLAAKRAELKKQQDDAAKAAQAQINKAIADADTQAKADAAKAAAAQAVADAKAAQAKAAAAKQVADTAKAAKAADEISNLINDQKSTGAKTGAGGSPAAGKPTGTAVKLTQSEIGALIAQIKKCWTLLPSEIDSGEQVQLMVSLNRDGSVDGTPQILQADAGDTSGSIARAAQRAVMQCQPYTTLPGAKYEGPTGWHQIDITMFTSDQ